jgi:hypothetical protein
MRPDDKTQWLLRIAGLSCRSSSHRLHRHRNKQKVHIFNKQLYTAGSDNCTALQVPPALVQSLSSTETLTAKESKTAETKESAKNTFLFMSKSPENIGTKSPGADYLYYTFFASQCQVNYLRFPPVKRRLWPKSPKV